MSHRYVRSFTPWFSKSRSSILIFVLLLSFICISSIVTLVSLCIRCVHLCSCHFCPPLLSIDFWFLVSCFLFLCLHWLYLKPTYPMVLYVCTLYLIYDTILTYYFVDIHVLSQCVLTPEVELEHLVTGLVCTQNNKLIYCHGLDTECRHIKPEGSEA